MRILYIDIDTLRPDHLGCYGYHRNTSPNIDAVAEQAVRFENCYVSDAPCLPSRSSLFSGRFGIHTDAVNHGGTTADPRRTGKTRGFKDPYQTNSWIYLLAKAGFHTVSVSPFAERHSAWWFYAGFKEMYNPGKSGNERADEVFPYAEKWLEENASRDNWFLHVNMWDPHTVYRTPAEFGNPFEKEPPPAWITEEKIRRDYDGYGPHSAHEPLGYGPFETDSPFFPGEIKTLEDYKLWIDGYDCGIRYSDLYAGKLLDILARKGVIEETAVIISADHGENQGELNVYGDHQTADHITCRVPYILKWPGLEPRTYRGLHYQNDLAATVLDLLGIEVPDFWDGRSLAEALRCGKESPREYLVVSQNAWSCQRAVRFGDYIMVKTYHTGFKHFPEYMLFDLKNDPHELIDLAKEKPALVEKAGFLLEKWHSDMMRTSTSVTDPLWITIAEGGPLHARESELPRYCRRLRETGRAHHAELLEKLRGRPVDHA